jgi:C-terminal processing protease CtpA/Prc
MAAQSRESVKAQQGKRLSEALKGRGLMPELGPEDRVKIIDTLVPLIEGVYCHLPQKRAGYAADPVQALRLLRQQCTELNDGEFHLAVTGIITGLRDAHTRYVGPSGLRDRVAVLPFLVESYGPPEAPRFIVSKVAKAALAPAVKRAGFADGVDLVSWNFVPMARAVDVYALQETGGRRDARRARALETLTFRSLDYGPPPDEYQVSIGFLAGRALREVVIPWRVVGIPPATLGRDPVVALRAAWNPSAESVRKAKTLMFAPGTWDASRRNAMGDKALRGRTSPARTSPAGTSPARTSRAKTAAAAIGTDLETSLPEVLSARTVPTTIHEGRRAKRVEVGYLRIWSFDVHDHEAFVTEVNRLIGLLPQDRLIVDLRGNPGGLIWAAERLLQLFTDKQVEPTRFSLVATPLTRAMAESEFNHLELDAWLDSLTDAVSTGEVYSQPIPLTDPAWCRDIGRTYPGKAVLVVDPNTYSSGDLFAAGWADHEIGPLVSIGEATGAGGANVWQDLQLNDALSGTPYEFDPLPDGVHFTMAIRRAIRSGLSDGVPIEDLGIRGVPYALTRRDLLEGNPDLLGFCAQTLNDWSPMS